MEQRPLGETGQRRGQSTLTWPPWGPVCPEPLQGNSPGTLNLYGEARQDLSKPQFTNEQGVVYGVPVSKSPGKKTHFLVVLQNTEMLSLPRKLKFKSLD